MARKEQGVLVKIPVAERYALMLSTRMKSGKATIMPNRMPHF